MCFALQSAQVPQWQCGMMTQMSTAFACSHCTKIQWPVDQKIVNGILSHLTQCSPIIGSVFCFWCCSLSPMIQQLPHLRIDQPCQWHQNQCNASSKGTLPAGTCQVWPLHFASVTNPQTIVWQECCPHIHWGSHHWCGCFTMFTMWDRRCGMTQDGLISLSSRWVDLLHQWQTNDLILLIHIFQVWQTLCCTKSAHRKRNFPRAWWWRDVSKKFRS